MSSLDFHAFRRGVLDVLTLRQLRRLVSWNIDYLVSWVYVTRVWGARCPDYEPGCICCEKWREHDELFGGRNA